MLLKTEFESKRNFFRPTKFIRIVFPLAILRRTDSRLVGRFDSSY